MFASALQLFLQVLGFCAVVLTATDAPPDRLAAEDWASIQAAHEESRYAVNAVEGGYEARNPRQQWIASFDGRGFSVLPDVGGWTWGLQLERYGFAGSEQEATSPARMSAEGGRMTYEWNEALEEWYVNDKRGLEHGFTVTERPVAKEQESANPLTFTFAVRGPLRPEVEAGGRGVHFQGESGAIMLTYTGLLVVDADGRDLVARFEHIGDKLLLCIDERGALYPLTIDPIAQQQAYLKASNTQRFDAFGTSVSVSGDTVVIGAPGEDSNATGVNGDQNDNNASSAGAAYVFVRSGATWSQQAYLKASNPEAYDQFGVAVSVSGDTVVVGAFSEDSSAASVNGDQSDNSSFNSGAAYVFIRNGTSWSQQAYLKARNSGRRDRFGISVDVSGDTTVVGASHEDSNATGVNNSGGNNSAQDAGAAYVFVRSGTTWSQQVYLKASNADAGDEFGIAVSVSGDTIVVGAPKESSSATGVNGNQSDNSASSAGAAYVFVRTGTSWSQQAYLKASNAQAGDFFGGFEDPSFAYAAKGVTVSGDTVVVGALGEDSNATGVNGNQSNNSAGQSGAAYVFGRSGTMWRQQSYLKASNTGVGDFFGFSVSASGDTVLVGAVLESSEGAAYVFVRSSMAWGQQAYLKASNADLFDAFAWSVSVSGGTLVVGAYSENSAATGVDGDQTDDSAMDAGAAYVFFKCPPVPPASYCTGKTTSAGCVPFVSFSGTPNVSSGFFDILSSDHIEAEPAIYLYSVGKANLNFHGGKLCVSAPFRRLTTLIKATDGLACTGCAGNCRMFKRDFNQLIQAGTDPMLTPGQSVHVQVRQSDPANLGPTGFADNLSDALSFTIAP